MKYQNFEKLLLKAATGNDFKQEFELLTAFYEMICSQIIFWPHWLHFNIFLTNLEIPSIQTKFDTKDYFSFIARVQRDVLSQVRILIKLILTMPATNATSKRSFSAFHQVKSYLRNTMGQERLNHVMISHVHRDTISI